MNAEWKPTVEPWEITAAPFCTTEASLIFNGRGEAHVEHSPPPRERTAWGAPSAGGAACTGALALVSQPD